MRDLDTIRLALTAAETGHLVFGTLHTSSASQTIDRIIDVFPEGQQQQVRVQLSNSLVAVFSQTLLPLLQADGTKSGRVMAQEVMLVIPAIAILFVKQKQRKFIQQCRQTQVSVCRLWKCLSEICI